MNVKAFYETLLRIIGDKNSVKTTVEVKDGDEMGNINLFEHQRNGLNETAGFNRVAYYWD